MSDQMKSVEPVGDETESIIRIIEKAAMDANVDAEKLERLMAMYERIAASKAKSAFYTAMVDAQSQMDSVRKDSSNPQTRSKYASLAALDYAVRPIYTKCGFAVSFNTDENKAPQDHIRIIAKVMHQAGHTEGHELDVPTDGKSLKGTDIMTKTHAAGSAISYGRRYLLLMIFNISVGDDDDGNRAGGRAVITTEQMQKLSDLADDVGADKQKFCGYMGVGSIADIPAARFEHAKNALERKRE